MSVRRLFVLAPMVVVVLVGSLLFSSGVAFAVPAYVPATSFSPPGGFGEPVGVAVDNSSGPDKGDVYVSDRAKDVIDEFSPAGVLLAQASLPGAGPDEMSVVEWGGPEGDLYVAGYNDGVIYRFSPGLASREELITGLSKPTDAAVNEDEGGKVYVSEEGGKILQFDLNGHPFLDDKVVGSGENTFIEGLDRPTAVAYRESPMTGNFSYVYVSIDTSTLLFSGTGGPLGEIIEPGGGESTGVTIIRGSNVYVDERGPGGGMQVVEYQQGIGSRPFVLTTIGLGTLSDRAYGLDVDSESGDVYVADAGKNVISVFRPENLSVSAGTRSARVNAQVDPKGKATTYEIEYGTNVPYESKTAEQNAGSGEGALGASVQLTGLTPDTTYHMRLVTRSEAGFTAGGDITFTTYPEGGSGLPDGRVFEMVTPLENGNADVYELTSGILESGQPFQASVNGDAVAYVGLPTVGGNGSSGDSSFAGNQYLASRSAQGGWIQKNVTPTGSNLVTEYGGFSSNLSTGFVRAFVNPPFSTTSSLAEPEGTNKYFGLYADQPGESLYRPLFTAKPPYRSSNEFAEPKPVYAGSSADTSHALFEANDALLESSEPVDTELRETVKKEVEEVPEVQKLREEGKQAEAEILQRVDDRYELYASVDGQLSLVNILPDGRVSPGAAFGGGSDDFDHDISADGSRIFWTGAEGDVYVREDGSNTVPVSEDPAEFWTASVDGRYAFYVEAGKLWRFDVETATRLELAGAAGGVVGVIGINETGQDGAYVYFVSREALTSETNAAGELPAEGSDNIYVYEPDPGVANGSRIVFVGGVSSEDADDWAVHVGSRTANVTPDGHALVFASHGDLTGKPYPGEGSEEVYVYDADDASLFCASCRSQASGGTIPGINIPESNQDLVYKYRHVSEDGDHVFFESSAPLVVQDINGLQDVYEWERDGTGECHEVDGCVYLLSNGIEGNAFFLDASANGSDVFIVTRQHLVPEDHEETSNLFDARVDGVRPVSPPECTGTGCQGVPASAPIFATPASVTFNGVGNFPSSGGPVVERSKSLTRAQKFSKALATCRRMRQKKRRGVCESRVRKAYGTKTGKTGVRKGK